MAICHTVISEQKVNSKTNELEMIYNASSPDELALTNAARFFGVVFQQRDSANKITIKDELKNKYLQYELLNVIEFTSSRKRMSVVVRTADNRILVLTKGADSIIIPLLAEG